MGGEGVCVEGYSVCKERMFGEHSLQCVFMQQY